MQSCITDRLFQKNLVFTLPKANDEESSDSLLQKENSLERVNTGNSSLSLSHARREIKMPLHLQDYILQWKIIL